MVRASGESVGTGGGLLKPGQYMFEVIECDEHVSKNGEGFVVVCTAVSGTGDIPSGQGATLRFQYMFGAKLWDFAAAVNLTDTNGGQVMTPESLEARREAQKQKQPVPDANFEPDEAKGRFFCADVVLDKPNDKGQQYPKIGFGVWHPLSKAAEGIPKDPVAMAMLTGAPVPAGVGVGDSAPAASGFPT